MRAVASRTADSYGHLERMDMLLRACPSMHVSRLRGERGRWFVAAATLRQYVVSARRVGGRVVVGQVVDAAVVPGRIIFGLTVGGRLVVVGRLVVG